MYLPMCCTQYPVFPPVAFLPQETFCWCKMDGSSICSHPSAYSPVCSAEEEKDLTMAKGWEISAGLIVLHISAVAK